LAHIEKAMISLDNLYILKRRELYQSERKDDEA
jgi:hypothetical protein